ncbi:MAG: hypothetical protein ACE5GE_13400 [Phycisphaerae bacterium]
MASSRVCLSGTLFMVVVSGCAGPAGGPSPSMRRYTMLREVGISQSSAFAAAEQALARRFRIELRQPKAGLLRTVPVSSVEQRSSATLSAALGVQSPVRRYVEVRVLAEGGDVTIGCKAIVQENQAVAHRTFERERGLTDIPSDTPADREAGATMEQRAVWKTTGRDQTLERDICRSIEQILRDAPEGGDRDPQ